MKGITEERLLELLRNEPIPNSWSAVLWHCTELTTWHPIETAPKDRTVLLFYPNNGQDVGSFDDSYDGMGWNIYNDYYSEYVAPTHWQELPEDPK